jgi:adenine-specific DNA-methyltransferase
MPAALEQVVRDVRARLLILSYNDESWMSRDDLTEICAVRGHVEVLSFPSARYVGARIGIHNPAGERVGSIGRLTNREYLVVSGERDDVRRVITPGLP